MIHVLDNSVLGYFCRNDDDICCMSWVHLLLPLRQSLSSVSDFVEIEALLPYALSCLFKLKVVPALHHNTQLFADSCLTDSRNKL